eukprot:9242340-Prorocentrum_lima.AAC.1
MEGVDATEGISYNATIGACGKSSEAKRAEANTSSSCSPVISACGQSKKAEEEKDDDYQHVWLDVAAKGLAVGG